MRTFTLVLLAGLAAAVAAEYDCAADPLAARLSAALSECRDEARARTSRRRGFFSGLFRRNLVGFPLVCAGEKLDFVTINSRGYQATVSQRGLDAFAAAVGLSEALSDCKAECAPRAPGRGVGGFFRRARRLMTALITRVWGRRGYPDVSRDLTCFTGCLNRARDEACAAVAEPVAEEFETEVELEQEEETLDELKQMEQDVQADDLTPAENQEIKDDLVAEAQEEEHELEQIIEEEKEVGEYVHVKTSGKWYDFASEDVGDKSVGEVSGVGSVTKTRMEEMGWTDANQLLYKYLSMGEDKADFQKWLEVEFAKPKTDTEKGFKINSRWRDEIYGNLKDFLGWCRWQKEHNPEEQLCTFDEGAADSVALPADTVYQEASEPLVAAEEESSDPEPDWRPTSIVLFKMTSPGEDVSIVGKRAGCEGSDEECRIPIRVVGLSRDAEEKGLWKEYDAWRQGDNFLNWDGAEDTQTTATEDGKTAFGTPLRWTTADHGHSHFDGANKFGDHHWYVRFEMDCSKASADGGWFAVSARLRNGANGDVVSESPFVQLERCVGQDLLTPVLGEGQEERVHYARCGEDNKFEWSADYCRMGEGVVGDVDEAA